MNATFEPRATGGGVFHSTDFMLTYQRGAFDGSAVKFATASRGRSMMIRVTTSTPMPHTLPQINGCQFPRNRIVGNTFGPNRKFSVTDNGGGLKGSVQHPLKPAQTLDFLRTSIGIA